MQKSPGGEGIPGIWSLGNFATVTLGEGQKPTWVGVTWRLVEKAGGERRTWGDSGVREGAVSYTLTFGGRRAV